jgi:N-acetylneuraminate synthase
MGGQQYQNLFLYPDEIRYFCEEYGYRICLDVSHSYLACNHLGLDPRSFFEQVAPYTAHIHIGDSAGVDGEGLQIGEGIIDFRMLAEVFNKHCPDATFIPEIWQGHKNSGEGFWIACERLEGIL